MTLHQGDLPTLIERWQTATTELARPCTCPRATCRTVAEHLWNATRDGRPGIPAASLEPSRSAGGRGLNLPHPLTPTDRAHDDLQRTLAALARSADDLVHLLGLWRSDRHTDGTPTTDDDWCRHHLATLTTCEPVYKGGLCRWCYDFGRAQGWLPPAELLDARAQGRKITATMVADAAKAAKAQARKRKRRKAAK